jgi:hypothetical protein
VIEIVGARRSEDADRQRTRRRRRSVARFRAFQLDLQRVIDDPATLPRLPTPEPLCVCASISMTLNPFLPPTEQRVLAHLPARRPLKEHWDGPPPADSDVCLCALYVDTDTALAAVLNVTRPAIAKAAHERPDHARG